VLQCHTSTGKDGKEYPRQVERKPEADRPTMAQAGLSALSDEEQEAVKRLSPATAKKLSTGYGGG